MHSTKLALLNLGRRRSRTAFTLLAIAIAVAMTILMTSAGLGLKAGASAMYVQKVDYWIVPTGSGVTDPIINSEQTMLGDVHQNIGMILANPDVNGASPVLNEVVYASVSASGGGDGEGKVEGNSNCDGSCEPKAILGIGVIPGAIDAPPVSSEGFTDGDCGGTGEAVINEKTSRLLALETGDLIYAGESQRSLQPFEVVNVVAIPEYSLYPIIVLHLSELQELTGNWDHDRANQIIVSGGTRDFLESVYPDATVLTNTELTAHNIYGDKRILATTVAVVGVSVLICVLFISTTMVISVNEKQREFAVMRAIGISDATIVKIVLCESVILSLAGGIIGALMSVGASAIILGFGVPLVMPPLLLVAGVALAVFAGVLSGIFPAMISGRFDLAKLVG